MRAKKELKIGSLVGIYMQFHTHSQYGIGVVKSHEGKMFVRLLSFFPGCVTGDREIRGDEELLLEDFDENKPSEGLFRVVHDLLMGRKDMIESLQEIAKTVLERRADF